MTGVKVNRALHYWLQKTGLIRIKEDLVRCYSNGRTSHSNELTAAEFSALLDYVRRQGRDATCDKLRKALIAQSYSIGEDINFVKGWSEKMGIFGVKKSFNAYTAQELKGLLEKFKKVVRHRMEAVNKNVEA